LCTFSSPAPCANNFPTTPGAFQTDFTANGVSGFVTKLNPTGSALVYSTYLGANVNAIALDIDGNAYLSSEHVPPTPGAFQTTPGDRASADAGVTKLNADGSALVYSTFLGGSGEERGFGIAVDAARNAYLTGRTGSPDFPTTPGAFQATLTSPFFGDAFVAKINPDGSALVYSTYLGGGSNDVGSAIAVDTSGNAYVTGQTFSSNFPTSPGAFQTTSSGGSDAYMTILNSTGTALVYSTYLGGSNEDVGNGIAVDPAGNAYVTGQTRSSNFPTTAGAVQQTGLGVFVAKFDVPPAPTRAEESAATEIGFWTTFGAETGTFSGGSIVASHIPASTALFSFTGTAVSWIGVKCNVCGIAAVSIDGGAPTLVDTAGPGAPGSLNSEPVFSVSGLAAGTRHVIAIIVTGRSTSGGRYVAVDAFDVTAGGATSLLSLPVAVPPLPRIPGL
jgi:hypothetical protein